jgi:hypothetical protein
MKDRITLQSAAGLELIFHPKSDEECAHLQERLFALGFRWSNGEKNVQNIAQCVQGGLVLLDGKIYFSMDGSERQFISCSIDQVDPGYVPPEQQFLVEMFTRLSAKVDALSDKVDRLYDELHVDVGETKPGLRPRTRGIQP